MGKVTGISWTDHTWNPWWGCTKVSAGCDHCYAAVFDKRVGGDHWGKGVPRRTFGDKHWNEPLKWNRDAEKDGVQRKVFCASMADIMDDEAPEGVLPRLWKLIDETPHLIWQLLTKRPQRYAARLPEVFKHRNVWLGTTCEDQANYDLRWPILRKAAHFRSDINVRWISYEPAIGPLDISPAEDDSEIPEWIICGGESGGGRREFKAEWAEELLKDCRYYETSFFMKQMSAITAPEGKKLIPAHLQIQEFPN